MSRPDPGITRGVMGTRSQTIVAACFRGRPERKWLDSLRGAGLELTFIDSRVEVVANALAERPRVVLLPASDARGVACAPLIARLRDKAPDVRVLLLLPSGSPGPGVVEAMRAGGVPVFFRTRSELLAYLTRDSEGEPVSEQDHEAIRALVGDRHAPALVDMLVFCAVHAHQPLVVSELARSFGLSRRAFTRRARTASWPTPVELIEWGRLLRASIVQWRASASLIALAHASGFKSPLALRRAVARRLMQRVGVPHQLSPIRVGTALGRRLDDLALAASHGTSA
ncbi:MAG: hypothetical protein ABI625_15975 [bacterium]